MAGLGLLLALASSVVWGAADFSGGSLTRRLPAFAVTVLSQAAGFVVLLVAIAVRGDAGGRSLALGLLAGVGGGVGLAAFYRALSLGTMSVVSPLVACGAVVPFAIALATGERPALGELGRPPPPGASPSPRS
jgi:drug/metabolite transporter (DMT)-like permease